MSFREELALAPALVVSVGIGGSFMQNVSYALHTVCVQVTSDVACLKTYKNIKPLNLQPLVSHRRLVPHQTEFRLH